MNRRCEPDAHPWHPIDGTHQRQCADCGVWADVDENPSVATESARVSGGQRGKVGSSAPSASDPRDAANVRGRGPTLEESNVNDRTPQRIQRKRSKGWKMPEGAVYVGRPTRWGNPVIVDAGLPALDYQGCTAAQAVEHYRNLITKRASFHSTGAGGGFMHVTANPVNSRGDIVPIESEIRDALAGRDLACWCPLDQPCHADVLLEVANA